MGPELLQPSGDRLVKYGQGAGNPRVFDVESDPEMLTQDDPLDRIGSETVELYEYYLKKLAPTWTRWVKHWRLYSAQRKATRPVRERWRSYVHVPYPFSGVQTSVGSFLDLIFSITPPIRPAGQGPDDIANEKKIERLFAYQMRKTDFQGELELYLIECFVQGIAWRRSTWVDDIRQIFVHPSQEEMAQFEEAVVAAIEAGMPLPPGFAPSPESQASGLGAPGGAMAQPGAGEDADQMGDAFEEWRLMAIQNGFQVPEPPTPGPQTIINYRGTGFKYVSAFDKVFDPAISRWEDQEMTFTRFVKPISWVKSKTDMDGKDANKPFDGKLVAEALGEMHGEGTAQGEVNVDSYQEEIFQMMGVSGMRGEEPHRKGDSRLVEIIEAYAPNTEFPYRLILNRHKKPVNKTKYGPYWHGESPDVVITNNRLPGLQVAMGEFVQPERLYYEMNTIRELRLDGVLLSVLPMFVRLREAGMVELAKKLIPGMIIEAARTDGISQLTNVDVPEAAYTEIDKIKQDIDETNATFPNVRGALSGSSSTTATETNRAFQNAMVRTTQRILRFEGQISKWIHHSLFNWYQFAKPIERIRVGGDPPIDPFITYRRKDFLAAIDMDFHFAGARTAVNTAEEVTALKDILTIGINAQIPSMNVDAIFRRIVELAARNADPYILSPEQVQQKQQEAAEAAEAQTAGEPPPPPAPAPAPGGGGESG
jgi:hypothetical protein